MFVTYKIKNLFLHQMTVNSELCVQITYKWLWLTSKILYQ